MKKLLQILTTSVVGAFLMVGAVGATGSNTSNCDIYQAGSASWNSCQNNTDTTSVKVVCVNNVYVIDNNSQNAGTGNATITNNGSGGYAASGNAQNTSGTTVTIGASCGQTSSTGTTTPPSSGGKGGGSGSTTTSKTTASVPAAKSSVAAAASLPETGSNTVVNAAIIGTALVVGGLAISFVGTALFRRAALK